MALTFRKHFISSGAVKARVHYSLDNRCDGRACVTMYAKSYDDGAALATLFGAAYANGSDSLTDYYEEGRATLFADHPAYLVARAYVAGLKMAAEIKAVA